MPTRRRALAALGTVSAGALLARCGDADDTFDGARACRVTAEQAEGPFYFDVDSIRSDIRENRPGTPLRLSFRVREAGSCEPIADAVVDIWHCDAGGVYSGFDEGEGERFLRGRQVTDRRGVAEFQTIYPGWYPGRTTHIHAKVHLDRQTALTTQVYFDDEVTNRVYGKPPYESGRDSSNSGDGIFEASLQLALREDGDGFRGAIGFDVERPRSAR